MRLVGYTWRSLVPVAPAICYVCACSLYWISNLEAHSVGDKNLKFDMAGHMTEWFASRATLWWHLGRGYAPVAPRWAAPDVQESYRGIFKGRLKYQWASAVWVDLWHGLSQIFPSHEAHLRNHGLTHREIMGSFTDPAIRAHAIIPCRISGRPAGMIWLIGWVPLRNWFRAIPASSVTHPRRLSYTPSIRLVPFLLDMKILSYLWNLFNAGFHIPPDLRAKEETPGAPECTCYTKREIWRHSQLCNLASLPYAAVCLFIDVAVRACSPKIKPCRGMKGALSQTYSYPDPNANGLQ